MIDVIVHLFHRYNFINKRPIKIKKTFGNKKLVDFIKAHIAFELILNIELPIHSKHTHEEITSRKTYIFTGINDLSEKYFSFKRSS